MFAKTVLAAAAVAVVAVAAPLEARQYTGSQQCTDSTSYKVDSSTAGPSSWTPVSGQACTSDKDDTCTVGAQASVSLGVSITTGGSLDLGEIAHIDTSVTWSYTTTKGESIGETCPKGGYVCGLLYQNQLATVKGKKIKTYGGTCVLAGQQESSDDYEFTAPVMIGDTPQITFKACISNSSPNKDTSVGLDLCPGSL
jgi:hypothetical protein